MAEHRPDDTARANGTNGHGAARRVSRGIMRALELRQLVPGQRLVETDLAAQFGVGRNAVRESVQWLAAHGVIDLTRHRSAAIRQLDPAEALAVLDVAEAIVGLAARAAAARFGASDADGPRLAAALAALERAHGEDEPGGFDRARRHFYRALIELGDNGELRRLFPALGLHIVYAQHRSPALGRLRLDDFRAIAAAVAGADAAAAEALGRAHVAALRAAIRAA